MKAHKKLHQKYIAQTEMRQRNMVKNSIEIRNFTNFDKFLEKYFYVTQGQKLHKNTFKLKPIKHSIKLIWLKTNRFNRARSKFH